MVTIKLSKLPDRAPVRLAVSVAPELHRALGRYAQFYRSTYDHDEAVADLVPAMLAAFLDSDKAFGRWCRDEADRQ